MYRLRYKIEYLCNFACLLSMSALIFSADLVRLLDKGRRCRLPPTNVGVRRVREAPTTRQRGGGQLREAKRERQSICDRGGRRGAPKTQQSNCQRWGAAHPRGADDATTGGGTITLRGRRYKTTTGGDTGGNEGKAERLRSRRTVRRGRTMMAGEKRGREETQQSNYDDA